MAGSSKDKASAVPAGFFDDALADAKARDVDVKQIAEKQLEQDWEQFQEFVAEVEQKEAVEEEKKQDESKERDAVETLENMAYVDRYRQVLEKAVKGATDEDAATAMNGKKRPAQDEQEEEEKDEELSPAQLIRTARASSKRRKQAEESDSDSDDFDPTNWRAKRV
ncbi:hypothetical protein Poli38472_014122 [Pythium oligandrum]|uniref:ZNF380 coiled-coil domain-containing protein n=1 Tax=Pythium oligandrum TaxID=41045 RepID=A0A8K1FK71_PYTOL|nr:hypothetical protein Poli38472_014122 [Pythium oligandrum]|eukprot:TMW66810.1 hypothetical protein Poli38472_014122 [Pythium oligandrum]